MARFAYLIMAHNRFDQLALLISMLDDVENDIYVHIDKKAMGWDEKTLKGSAKYSEITILSKSIDVQWGQYSQVECELALLSAAARNAHYTYYHLLSGMDLPIKSQKEIKAFFNANSGKEFIRFESEKFRYKYRYQYYYGFMQGIDRPKTKLQKGLVFAVAATQRFLGIDRSRENPDLQFQKGTNWFSITDALANFVLDKEEWIRQTFENTYCCDELFLQTIVHNSPFRENLYHSKYDNDCRAIQRVIDWKRGNPYIFRLSDYEELVNSDLMFARKFDSKVDEKIILKLKEFIEV